MIKAELNIDLEQLKTDIVQDMVNSLLPHLKGKEDDGIIFDVEGLAEYIKTSKRWIYEQPHLNAIPFYKIGRFPRFRKKEIDKWLEQQKVPATASVSRPLKVIK